MDATYYQLHSESTGVITREGWLEITSSAVEGMTLTLEEYDTTPTRSLTSNKQSDEESEDRSNKDTEEAIDYEGVGTDEGRSSLGNQNSNSPQGQAVIRPTTASSNPMVASAQHASGGAKDFSSP